MVLVNAIAGEGRTQPHRPLNTELSTTGEVGGLVPLARYGVLEGTLQAGTPRYSKPWHNSFNWCCANRIPPKMACHSEGRVTNSILWEWCHMRQHLVRHILETIIEWTRKPLFWNPHV